MPLTRLHRAWLWASIGQWARALQDLRPQTEFVELPGGDSVGVTLQEHRGNTLTLEVAITQRNTQSRVTVEKGQRIVHGVSPEKGGEAVFIVLTGWP